MRDQLIEKFQSFVKHFDYLMNPQLQEDCQKLLLRMKTPTEPTAAICKDFEELHPDLRSQPSSSSAHFSTASGTAYKQALNELCGLINDCQKLANITSTFCMGTGFKGV